MKGKKKTIKRKTQKKNKPARLASGKAALKNNNALKKKGIEGVMANFGKRLSFLKKKRDFLISEFTKTLKEKRMEQIRKSLNQ